MTGFVQETAGIYRLRVPFENLTTSVFLLLTQEGPALYDCATTAQDVEEVILPALKEMQIVPEQLQAVIISHAHADHSGGAAALMQHAPQARLIACAPQKYDAEVYVPADREVLLGTLQALYLPGHTADCLGLHDLRTDTLLTADALQLRGIDRFGCSLAAPGEYVRTIARIRRLAPGRILAAHAYAPYGDKAEGAVKIVRYLDGCADALEKIRAFTAAHHQLDAQETAAAFCRRHPAWPLLPAVTVRSIRKENV